MCIDSVLIVIGSYSSTEVKLQVNKLFDWLEDNELNDNNDLNEINEVIIIISKQRTED